MCYSSNGVICTLEWVCFKLDQAANPGLSKLQVQQEKERARKRQRAKKAKKKARLQTDAENEAENHTNSNIGGKE